MELPLISIIIPVYNAEKTIGRAIKSVLNQSSLDFELLIINDGSTDDSLMIMKKFADIDSRIRIFDIENSGVSNARNHGIKYTRGMYTTFLDADDYYINESLENILSSIDNENQLVIFGYNIEYENKYSKFVLPSNEIIQFTNENDLREYVISLIRNEMINAPWNKIYLTSYLKENDILFPGDLDIGEDLKFNLSVIKDIQNAKIFNKAVINYTVKKGNGLVSRFRPNRIKIRFFLLMELKELLTYWNLINENQAMIDQMLIRDIMAYFMDLYKNSCNLTYNEKKAIIKELIQKKEIREIIAKKHSYDFLTKVIRLILRTNNSRIILLSAKILNIKRVLR